MSLIIGLFEEKNVTPNFFYFVVFLSLAILLSVCLPVN